MTPPHRRLGRSDNVRDMPNDPVVRDDIRARLTFYKVMAVIVGIGLLLLVLGVILRYGFDHPTLSKTWSPIHGFLYIVYLVATALLGVRAQWSVPKIVGVMLAGTVPFLSFWMERQVARSFEAVPAD
jgi:integral membrane protein